MTYRKYVLPSALIEFETFCRVQGRRIRREAREWTDDLARVASRMDACLTAARLETVLGRIQSDLPSGMGRGRYAFAKFKRTTLKKKLRVLLAVVRKRSPPWEPFVAERRFQRGDGVCPVLCAWFEISHVTKQIVFTMFSSDEDLKR